MCIRDRDGIRSHLEPPAAVEQNIYEMDLATRKMNNINSLPENLYEAINELRQDTLIQLSLIHI